MDSIVKQITFVMQGMVSYWSISFDWLKKLQRPHDNVLAEIWIGYLPNISHKHYHLIQLVLFIFSQKQQCGGGGGCFDVDVEWYDVQ